MMAYCVWLKDGPPFWQLNHIDDGHSTNSFLLDGWMSFDYKSGAGHFGAVVSIVGPVDKVSSNSPPYVIIKQRREGV